MIKYLFFNCMFQLPVIKALAILKLCAAEVNKEYGLKSDIADAIKLAAQEVGFLSIIIQMTIKSNSYMLTCTLSFTRSMSNVHNLSMLEDLGLCPFMYN